MRRSKAGRGKKLFHKLFMRLPDVSSTALSFHLVELLNISPLMELFKPHYHTATTKAMQFSTGGLVYRLRIIES